MDHTGIYNTAFSDGDRLRLKRRVKAMSLEALKQELEKRKRGQAVHTVEARPALKLIRAVNRRISRRFWNVWEVLIGE
jgi:hypothetical protein